MRLDNNPFLNNQKPFSVVALYLWISNGSLVLHAAGIRWRGKHLTQLGRRRASAADLGARFQGSSSGPLTEPPPVPVFARGPIKPRPTYHLSLEASIRQASPP